MAAVGRSRGYRRAAGVIPLGTLRLEGG